MAWRIGEAAEEGDEVEAPDEHFLMRFTDVQVLLDEYDTSAHHSNIYKSAVLYNKCELGDDDGDGGDGDDDGDGGDGDDDGSDNDENSLPRLPRLVLRSAKTAMITGDKICKGVQCFKHSFLIITGVTFAGALVSLLLVWRTRSFYKGDIYAKFKVAPAAATATPEAEEKTKKDGAHESN
uniref:Uncharacterized protein n=1 Tax=Oryza brachyantha TaxID=4533 RepID=J3N955_ORYBR